MGAVFDLLLPPLCLNCRRQRRQELGLCAACLAQLERTGLRACPRCGRHCSPGRCAPGDHHYSRVLSLAAYLGPWRQVVQTVKFGRARNVAVELGQALVTAAQAAGLARPALVTPAPAASRSWRNYDLLGLLAGELARANGAPFTAALGRRPGRPPQVELSLRGRIEGLAEYIYVLPAIAPRGVVWLVDDVYTTGATADACAQVLLAAGARSVFLLTLAV